MSVQDHSDLSAIRYEAATVRMLLEELDQLTGDEARHVGQQLGERLAVLARRLNDASTSLACTRAAGWSTGIRELDRAKP